ncbi:MAG: hypothetical protein DWH86_01085 [Planctomycetota bacterium]|nr:MAG: hypothetical protein DWH86_01085 [Planctomycetota bacterium]
MSTCIERDLVRKIHVRSVRRGVVMLAVLVVLAVAALVAGGLLAASEAEHAGLAAMRDRTQQRAIAWSGCQAVAALLSAQRNSLADGETPELPDEILLYEADGAQAVARLLPVGPSGERLIPECAKFALAGLDPAMLAGTGVIDSAAATVAVARGGNADAIEAIVQPESGLTADRVIGPVAAGIAAGVRRLQDSSGSGARGAIPARVRTLAVADVATPFAAQRALGSGVTGTIVERTPLGAWSSEGMAAIDARTSGGTAERMRSAIGGETPTNQGMIVRSMRLSQLSVDKWSAVLDAVVAGNAAVEHGQVDIANAPEEVLRAIPAVGAELAAKMVQARASLAAGEHAQLAWPVTSGALTPEEFEAIAPFVCARSWLWRARVATGVVDGMQEGSAMRGIEVWEVVVDLAEDPPRFASIRDCTLLPIAAALAEQVRTEQVASGERKSAAADQVVDDEPDSSVAMANGSSDSGMETPSAAQSGADSQGNGGADDSAMDDGSDSNAGTEAAPPSWKREPWRSPAADAVRAADAARKAESDAREVAQRARDTQGAWKPSSEQAPEAVPESGPWSTLADREKQARESKARGWSTLADRERADREERSGKWKTLGERERDDRDARSKEWKSLGDQERERRAARDAEERDRRKQQSASMSHPFQATRWDDKDVPPDPAGVASRAEESGKDDEQASSSGSSTGGLSGRWRRRSDSSP